MHKNLGYLPAAFALFAGILLSTYLYDVASTNDLKTAQHKFEDQALERMLTIESRIQKEIAILHSIVGFFNSSVHVDRSEFRSFSQAVLPTETSFQALEWIPAVSHPSRQAFTELAVSEGLPNFEITEKSQQGHIIPAKVRETYYPVYYVEPFADNKTALGFDLGSNPDRRAALEKARDMNQLVVTPKIELVQLREDNTGVLAFIPIYKKNLGNNTLSQRQENLLGFSLGVISISKLFSDLSISPDKSPANTLEIDFYLYDENEDNEKDQLLYAYKSTASESNPVLKKALASVHASHSFNFGTRKWTLVAKPIDPHFSSATTPTPWVLTTVSLLFTLMLTLYIFSSIQRTSMIEALVSKRTKELKEAVRQALQDEAHIRAIVDHSAEGIIAIDSEGLIRDANPAAERIFGYQAYDLIGQNISMLVPPEYRDKHENYVENSHLFTDRIINQARELVGYRQDGTVFPMELNVSCMETDEGPLYIGILHDITARKQAEVSKNEFVSTVSHELRTPLTSIKGSLGLLRSGAFGALTEKAQELVELAYVNCDRQINLVNDLLDMEKIAAGKMDYHMTQVDLNKALKSAIAANRDFAGNHNVRFNFHDNYTPAFINADQNRVIQVLTNLLSNAAKFSPDDGHVDIILIEKDDHYQVRITDFGPGIAKAFRDKIFQRFTQGDASDTRAKGGTGLGLHISKVIIEKHGGHIDFESEEGQGATFYFDLPKLEKPP